MSAALSIKRQHFFRITRNFLALLSTFFIVGLFVFRLCFISNKREMRQSLKERKGKRYPSIRSIFTICPLKRNRWILLVTQYENRTTLSRFIYVSTMICHQSRISGFLKDGEKKNNEDSHTKNEAIIYHWHSSFFLISLLF